MEQKLNYVVFYIAIFSIRLYLCLPALTFSRQLAASCPSAPSSNSLSSQSQTKSRNKHSENSRPFSLHFSSLLLLLFFYPNLPIFVLQSCPVQQASGSSP
ncbi:hypothetical protein V8C35DRAFT_308635 [Trichoderma chlorosporum]